MDHPYRKKALVAALRATSRADHGHGKRKSALRIVQSLQREGHADLPSGMIERLQSAHSVEDLDRVLAEIINSLEPQNRAESVDSVILMIEDDALTARIQQDALSGIESEVVVARDATEAELLLRQHNVSIILLDLVLPDADGRDLLTRLRASAATRVLPIIVITARIDAATQAECFALGADALLTKPVDPEMLAAVVAAHLDHSAELRTAGRVDRLTGLVNRAALSDTMERLAPLARRTRNPLAVAMIDLDYFKAVNDTHGHDMGDTVLRTAAQTVVKALRVSDITSRWGGEEFCVLLPDTTVRGAARALRKALDAVRALVFNANGETFSISFSAGVAAVSPRGTAEEAIKEADRLLYLAKRSGRNCVFSPEDEADPPRPRVLLVEDDSSVARVVSALLSREGFDVAAESDAESALRAAEAEHFVLAVIDVELPGMKGLELVERLRATPTSARLPIVLLTGSADEEDIVRGFSTGANDYITKPFLPLELAARINRLVPRR